MIHANIRMMMIGFSYRYVLLAVCAIMEVLLWNIPLIDFHVFCLIIMFVYCFIISLFIVCNDASNNDLKFVCTNDVCNISDIGLMRWSRVPNELAPGTVYDGYGKVTDTTSVLSTIRPIVIGPLWLSYVSIFAYWIGMAVSIFAAWYTHNIIFLEVFMLVNTLYCTFCYDVMQYHSDQRVLNHKYNANKSERTHKNILNEYKDK